MKTFQFLTFCFLTAFVLFGTCVCPPTPTVSSARRWVSPCHPTSTNRARGRTVSAARETDLSFVRVVVDHISEIKRACDNLADKFRQTRRISAHSVDSFEELITRGQFLNGFPTLTFLTSRSQQSESRNLSLHLLKDYEIISVMAVYIEQAIKDERDVREWKPKWHQIESKLLTILCNLQKCLTRQQQEIADHVSSGEILDDCTEGRNCGTLTRQADKYNRDYMVLKTMSFIFEILIRDYQSISESIDLLID